MSLAWCIGDPHWDGLRDGDMATALVRHPRPSLTVDGLVLGRKGLERRSDITSSQELRSYVQVEGGMQKAKHTQSSASQKEAKGIKGNPGIQS